MIEVIYKDEKREAKGDEGVFSIPRNIRQIGLVNEAYRIYIEDYVYTFLGRLAASENLAEKAQGSLAVLTGETGWMEGASYLFIRGALIVEEAEAAPDHIDFSEKVWAKIHEELEKYFPGQEITGWFFTFPQLAVEVTELLEKIHLRHFGGEKVLMLMEPGEREEAFFRYENGRMTRQSGYYIYYEKNPLMQEYMIEKNRDLKPELTENVEDEAVKAFRKIILGKKKDREPKQTEEHTSVFSYAATACLVIAVGAVGASFYRNYQKLQRVEERAASASALVVRDEVETEKLPATETPVPLSVTPIPTPVQETAEAEPTAVPEAEETAAEEMTETGSGETASEIYKEESDIRKAKRREELAAQEEQAETDAAETAQTETHEKYVIRPGDTLYQISIARYGSMDPISEICRLNGLTENQIIYPGQVIVLP